MTAIIATIIFFTLNSSYTAKFLHKADDAEPGEVSHAEEQPLAHQDEHTVDEMILNGEVTGGVEDQVRLAVRRQKALFEKGSPNYRPRRSTYRGTPVRVLLRNPGWKSLPRIGTEGKPGRAETKETNGRTVSS
jgi:hypothetical protein